MNKLIKSKGWKKLEDDYVSVANHEENIKTKNIVEKIKFDGEPPRFLFFSPASFQELIDVFFRCLVGHVGSHQVTANLEPSITKAAKTAEYHFDIYHLSFYLIDQAP